MEWRTASFVWRVVISMSVALKKLKLPTKSTIKLRKMPIKREHPSDTFKFTRIGCLALMIELKIDVFGVVLENGGYKGCVFFEIKTAANRE